MNDLDQRNLFHVYEQDCKDPDCEIHNPQVGISEGTVSLTNVAFYYAGALEVVDIFLHCEDLDLPEDANDEDQLHHILNRIRDRLNGAIRERWSN